MGSVSLLGTDDGFDLVSEDFGSKIDNDSPGNTSCITPTSASCLRGLAGVEVESFESFVFSLGKLSAGVLARVTSVEVVVVSLDSIAFVEGCCC